MRRLTGLSFAHPSVGAKVRAPLYLADEAVEEHLRRLHGVGLDVFLLATCLRVEILWAGDAEAAPDVLACLYGTPEVGTLGELRRDGEVFTHLCRIAAGLASPVIGETEILAQFRQGIARYETTSGSTGSLLPVLEAAVGVGRSARRALPSQPAGSLAALAARTANSGDRVAILGSGAMARAAAQHLPSEGVSVFSRRPALVAGRPSLPWAEVPAALATFPAVISTVPGAEALFDGAIPSILGTRSEPLLLIDLGMPPVFHPPLPGPVRYVGVDDIAAIDQQPVPVVEQSLREHAGDVWGRLSSPARAGAIVSAVLGEAERAVDEEVRRFANRLGQSEDPEAVLRQLAHTVARRILHRPISYLGSRADEQVAETVAEAFGVDHA